MPAKIIPAKLKIINGKSEIIRRLDMREVIKGNRSNKCRIKNQGLRMAFFKIKPIVAMKSGT